MLIASRMLLVATLGLAAACAGPARVFPPPDAEPDTARTDTEVATGPAQEAPMEPGAGLAGLRLGSSEDDLGGLIPTHRSNGSTVYDYEVTFAGSPRVAELAFRGGELYQITLNQEVGGCSALHLELQKELGAPHEKGERQWRWKFTKSELRSFETRDRCRVWLSLDAPKRDAIAPRLTESAVFAGRRLGTPEKEFGARASSKKQHACETGSVDGEPLELYCGFDGGQLNSVLAMRVPPSLCEKLPARFESDYGAPSARVKTRRGEVYEWQGERAELTLDVKSQYCSVHLRHSSKYTRELSDERARAAPATTSRRRRSKR